MQDFKSFYVQLDDRCPYIIFLNFIMHPASDDKFVDARYFTIIPNIYDVE